MMLSGKARIAGVIGWPIAHSKSPQLHGYWLQRYGIDGAVIPLAVKPGDFTEIVRDLPKMGFAGAFVTLPHKQAAVTAVDQIEDAAKIIGAVNMISVNQDGSLYGQNTDGFGFIENIKHCVPHWEARSGPAAVMGAGGAARAVLYALFKAGVPHMRLYNRNAANAQSLAAALNPHVNGIITVHDWAARQQIAADVRLVVNTTSLGMSGQPPLDLSLQTVDARAVVADIVYAPLMTDLLRAAEARGHAIVDGLGMLIHQARPGFHAWFGRDPEIDDEVRAVLLAP